MSPCSDKLLATKALRQVKEIVHDYRGFRPRFICLYPGTASYTCFYWKMITFLQKKHCLYRDRDPPFPSSCCLSGNGAPDGPPLKRELKALCSVDLTELYKVIYCMWPFSICPLQLSRAGPWSWLKNIMVKKKTGEVVPCWSLRAVGRVDDKQVRINERDGAFCHPSGALERQSLCLSSTDDEVNFCAWINTQRWLMCSSLLCFCLMYILMNFQTCQFLRISKYTFLS